MKSKSLQPFKEPPPPERVACRACRTFAPECLVPVGDDAVPMCWLCAHHVTEHNAPPNAPLAVECKCPAHEIYPHRALAEATRVVDVPVAPPGQRMVEREKLLRGSQEKLLEWAREAHKQMSTSQHAAVKQRIRRINN